MTVKKIVIEAEFATGTAAMIPIIHGKKMGNINIRRQAMKAISIKATENNIFHLFVK
ncbi:MAG: hypothetical protein UX08_C0003G0067 [Candidatus Collierbacteria bacterium GW2011_GWB1_45_35]|uniref:Uncharacterized protein n=1 Tax=Candidatus Collierbacteria bacterium GW2011_GWB2_45_17 TaxID=1618388 RepID=A0A837IJ51_9BACT|nr:MAG: hypothetical protein UW48_C0006G0054 [Microgenomates group bacterium GW2011_GWC1_44_23]KKT96027.1 MAG: hypothetical protein UW96_C0002G0054 [Candidatus Collierbacteria bacterium GW2011_GWA1_45_15]KKU01099.1 MAG: hypothetical protein UX01_C0002G0065 [Candidatus Collierbacteria bacterium GW2011_GWB2_45_17]KKU05711.1 MAG: hypothetical protein UX08_C0003G0067 [Candidatus Collierbacteria bacterium GW2011_GWB1_45_35]KKU08089.1 MAG: hypothetical protein UX11_C0007G0054 [Candidatus Collierbacte